MKRDLKWEKMYEYAKKYYEAHGNLEVPYLFKTNDGYTYSEDGVKLGIWITTQRQYCEPSSENGKKLAQLGMRFHKNKIYIHWEEMYEYAKKYYEAHGNLEVPHIFRTNDGFTYDPNGGIKLGFWIHNQRKKCDPESLRGKKLLEIGMRFEARKRSTLTWEEMYEYAKKYYEVHRNLEIQPYFKTNDGYTYDINGNINLGRWIVNQRRSCDPSSERGKKLLEIGMRFKNKNDIFWEKMYECAMNYYKAYGNLDIPQRFKTSDGLCLGRWIWVQRSAYKNNELNEERILMLNSIGMIWNVSKNRFEIALLCDKFGIDIEQNRTILGHISYIEFETKLIYLKKNNIIFVGEDGILHEIFSMSSMNMKEKYGFSLEELINEYHKDCKKYIL